MKAIELAGIWRALEKAPDRPVQLRQFSFRSLAGLVDDAISFKSPLTAICGLSGVGKSALLRAIWANLDWTTASQLIEVRGRLATAQLSCVVDIDRTEYSASLSVDEETVLSNIPKQLQILHFDPSIVAASLQRKFCMLQGLPHLLDAYEPIELTSEEVAIVSYISKRDYKSIRIFEIDEFEDGQILPFTQINDGRFEYDTRTMSLGEISILLCFWTLRRAEEGAIFLAEEPETYISPGSQAALVNYLASVCVRRQLFIIFTTHSPQMVSALSEQQVKFVFQTHAGSRLAPADQDTRMRRMVGLEVPIDLFIPVEDRVAREFMRLLLARTDHSLSLRTEVLDVGGEGTITKLRQLVPRHLKAFSLIGVYDGDMRGRIDEDRSEWPLVFLPVETAVDATYQRLSLDHAESFADKLGRGFAEFQVTLAGLAGRDHHDWFEETARSLGLSYDHFMMAAFECWYSLEENKERSSQFLREVLDALERARG